MFCTNCGVAHNQDDKFCSSCGSNLQSKIHKDDNIICPSCLHENKTSAAFCIQCGERMKTNAAPVQSRKKRKQSAKTREKINKRKSSGIAGRQTAAGSTD